MKKYFKTQEYKSNILSCVKWFIPFILGVSVSSVDSDDSPIIFGIQITPFLSINFGVKGTMGGYKKIK